MPRIAVPALLALLLLAPRWAAAQVAWMCALSDDAVRLVCIADTDPLHDAPTAQPPTAQPPTAQPPTAQPPTAQPPTAIVNGTRFPLDPRQPYVVDLWSPPTEMDAVERLARATICYRSPGCSVVLVDRWAAHVPPPARRLARATHALPGGSGGTTTEQR